MVLYLGLRRGDVSAKDASNSEFEVSMEWLIRNILCCEQLFGPGMRCLINVLNALVVVHSYS